MSDDTLLASVDEYLRSFTPFICSWLPLFEEGSNGPKTNPFVADNASFIATETKTAFRNRALITFL